MDSTQLASYGLGAVGLVIVVTALVPMFSMQVNATMANALLIKLARANNLERVVKLCAAAPGTYFDAAKASTLAATATRSDDPMRVEAAAREAFDASGELLAGRWRRLTERGLFGVIVMGGGVGLALSSASWSIPIGVIGGVAALLGAYLLARRGGLDAALARCRSDVLPEIVRAAVAGTGAKVAPRVEAAPKPAPTPTPARPVAAIDLGLEAVVESAAAAPAALPARSAPARTLRDGRCPLCEHPTIRTVARGDDRFTTYVCEGCGYTQEFADLTRLDR